MSVTCCAVYWWRTSQPEIPPAQAAVRTGARTRARRGGHVATPASRWALASATRTAAAVMMSRFPA